MNTAGLKCLNCGGEFDFEEKSILRPGSTMSTIVYDKREEDEMRRGDFKQELER